MSGVEQQHQNPDPCHLFCACHEVAVAMEDMLNFERGIL